MSGRQQGAGGPATGFAAKLDPYLLLTLLISAAAALPLAGPYFVGSHDGILAVYRFFQFDRSIQDGILVPGWAPDLFFGYGYPFFTFYAPLSYYVAEGFHLLGLGFVASISGTFALGFVLSGLFMYLLVRDLGGRWAAVLAATAYVFAPYHLVDAHLRGDLAEFFALVWFPAILWTSGRLVSRASLSYLALTALFYGTLLITHNIMALAFSPLLAAYLAFLLLRQREAPAWGRRSLYALSALALAFGLSAYFWAPALAHLGQVQIGRLANDPSFYYRSSLLQGSSFISDNLFQDYSFRSPQGDYGYLVELGLAQVVMAVTGVALLAWQRRRRKEPAFGHLATLGLVALAYYAIMFPWALFLWDRVPLMSYLQSPWRLLPFLILSSSVLIGYLGRWASRLPLAWGCLALALLALTATVPNVVNLQPRYVDLREAEISVPGSLHFEMLSQDLGMTAAGEYLPKGVRSKMGASPKALDALSQGQPPSPFDASFLAPGAEVETVETRTTLGLFKVQSPKGTPFLFNQTYFPGWRAYLDRQEVPLDGVGTANLMSVQVPPGPHDLDFRFQDTRVRLLGKAASLVSLAVLALVLLLALRRAPAQGQQQVGTPSAEPEHLHPWPLAGLVLVLATLAAAYLVQRPAPPPPSGAAFPVEATWRGGPTLLGYDLSPSPLEPGQDMDLALYWRGKPPDLELRIGLKGRTGQVWGQAVRERLGPEGEGPASKEMRRIRLPRDLPPGMYAIAVDIWDGGKPLPLQAERLARPIFPEKSLLLGPVFVGRGAPAREDQVTISTLRQANLGNQGAFLGYDLGLGGRALDLTTYWKALSIMREDYAILAHLLDATDKVLSYQDLQPEGNPYPTTLWRPGEVVEVPFHFDLPPGFTPEGANIALGFYTPDNFKRVPLLDPAGHPFTDTIYLALRPGPGR